MRTYRIQIYLLVILLKNLFNISQFSIPCLTYVPGARLNRYKNPSKTFKMKIRQRILLPDLNIAANPNIAFPIRKKKFGFAPFGGGGESRAPVRKPLNQTFYERIR